MFCSTVIFALIAILLASYYYVNRKFSYWKYHNLPYIKGTSPFGTINPLSSKLHISERFASFYEGNKNKNFPFVGMFLFLEPFILATNLDLVKSVLVKDFNYFTNRGLYYNERDDPLSAHLFSIEDQKWKDLRIKLTPTFTSGKMKYMFPTVIATSKELIACVERESKLSNVLEFKEIVSRFTTDVIGTCAFGIECNSLENPNTEFRNMGRRVFQAQGLSFVKAFFTLANRDLSRKLRLTLLNPVVTKFFLRVIRDTIDYRTKNNVERSDFMNLLISLQKEHKQIDGHELTFEELAAQAFVFWIAGFETSSSVMSYALLELGYNHEIQNKAREEIQSVLKKHGGEFTYEAMLEMKYLGQIINESLRRFPPVAHLRRNASKDYREPQTGYIIRKNQTVVIPILGIQNDPQYFPNPNVFDPDRFTDEEIAKRDPFAFLPFGDGPRNCIGLRFGLMQTKIGLATLLMNYKFSHSSKTQYPPKISKKSFTLSSDGGLFLNVEKC